MYKPSRDGLLHVIDAFGFSMRGLQAAWRHETAFRIHVGLALALVVLQLSPCLKFLFRICASQITRRVSRLENVFRLLDLTGAT